MVIISLRVSHIQVFGCQTYTYGSNQKHKTLDIIGIVNIMVVYVTDDIGYRLLDTINFFNAIKCFGMFMVWLRLVG